MPEHLLFGYVKGTLIRTRGDGSDEDRYPDVVGATDAKVTFTRQGGPVVASNPPRIVSHAPVAALVMPDGQITGDLNGANIAPDAAPGVWLVVGTYTVSTSNFFPDFTIVVTSEHTLEAPLDLAVAAGVPTPPAGATLRYVAVPTGGSPGQALVATETGFGWAPLPDSGTSGSLDASGVNSGFVPTAQGDDTWEWAAQTGTGGTGVTDHGALTGLGDDDHPQYLTEARGDARYDATGTAATLVGGLSIPTAPEDIGAQPAGDYVTFATLPEVDLSGYVESTDSRLSDARPPTTHRHPWTDLDDVPVIPTSPGDIGAAPAGDYATNPALTAEAQARQAADSALSDAITLRQTAEQVDARVQQVVGTAPAALDTLGEIAERLADDADAVAALTSAVADKADAGHNHDGVYAKPADLPDVSDVVREGDPRLTDARTPTAHDHAIDDVTGLQAALDGKQPSGSYAPATHDHDDRYYTEAQADGRFVRTVNNTGPDPNGNVTIAAEGGGATDHGALTGLSDDDHPQYALTDGTRGAFAATDHSHAISGVTGLQAALDGKADSAHDHDGTYQPVGDYATRDELPTVPDVSDVVREGDPRLTDARTPTAHSHAISGVTGLQDALDGKADAAHDHDGTYQPVGDYATRDELPTVPDVSDVIREGDPRLTDDRDPTAHSHTAAQISDATTLGRTIMQASSATAARTAIGAGTSNLQLGTGSTTAAAGNHTHDDRYYTEGEVDTALAGKANTTHSHPEYAPATQAINAQTGTAYTLTATDVGKVVTVANASPVTVTVPASTFTAGQRVDVLQRGAGSVTLAAGAGMTLHGTPSLVTRAQWSAVSVLILSATEGVVIGDLATP